MLTHSPTTPSRSLFARGASRRFACALLATLAGFAGVTGAQAQTTPAQPAPADKPASSEASAVKPGTAKPSAVAQAEPIVDKDGKPIAEGTTKVYVVNMTGEFGRDISRTPIQKVMDDVVRIQPDVLIYKFDFTFEHYGEKKADFQTDIGQYDLLQKAAGLDTLIMERVDHSSDFKTRPRSVAWVKKALGGSAFLVYPFPEVYFTSDALHGGLGGLESMFDGRGDDRAREKQRSLRLAQAKGLAEKGRHESKLIEAMSRGDNILSYKIETGKVVFLDRMPEGPDEILLKDDGAVNKEHADTLSDVVRYKGNDYLTLDAKTAFEIGFSKGTADTVDDLLYKMGITRNFAIVKGKSATILGDWSKEIDKAEKDFRKIIREQVPDVKVKAPAGFKERTAARGQRKALYQRAIALITKYEEALNPKVIGGADATLSQLRLAIDTIEREQRADKPEATTGSP